MQLRKIEIHSFRLRLDIRSFLSDNERMRGSEFKKKIKALAKRNNIVFKHVKNRGKGSHSTLFYGEKFTIIRNLKDELKTGTCSAMLKQLGIDKKDLGEEK